MVRKKISQRESLLELFFIRENGHCALVKGFMLFRLPHCEYKQETYDVIRYFRRMCAVNLYNRCKVRCQIFV